MQELELEILGVCISYMFRYMKQAHPQAYLGWSLVHPVKEIKYKHPIFRSGFTDKILVYEN